MSATKEPPAESIMEPDPGYHIGELHAWIGVHPNGGEGLLSADMEIDAGVWRHMPLMSTKRQVALRLRGLAERAVAEARATAGVAVEIKLVAFRRVPDA